MVLEYAVKHIYGYLHFNCSSPMQIPMEEDKIKVIGARPKDRWLDSIIVSVLNYGKNDVTLSAVAIFDDTGIMIDSIPLSKTIRPGKTENILIQLNTRLSSGRKYEVKVITARGAEAAYPFIAKA